MKHVTLPDIICNHLLPALPDADQNRHIAYLAVIISSGLAAPEAANASLAAKIIDRLMEVGKIATKWGFMQPKEDFLHLPISLGNKVKTPESVLLLMQSLALGCMLCSTPEVKCLVTVSAALPVQLLHHVFCCGIQ